MTKDEQDKLLQNISNEIGNLSLGFWIFGFIFMLFAIKSCTNTAHAFMPTVNSKRVEYGYYEPPYWLGLSVPPNEYKWIDVFQDNQRLCSWQGNGTEFKLCYITDTAPVYIYDNGKLAGTMIPEPATMILAAIGVFFTKTLRRSTAGKNMDGACCANNV
jgi:hypothetical protein